MNGYFIPFPCRQRYNKVFTLATLPICKRAAIHATGTSVSCRNRTAIFTFSNSPFFRSPPALPPSTGTVATPPLPLVQPAPADFPVAPRHSAPGPSRWLICPSNSCFKKRVSSYEWLLYTFPLPPAIQQGVYIGHTAHLQACRDPCHRHQRLFGLASERAVEIRRYERVAIVRLIRLEC